MSADRPAPRAGTDAAGDSFAMPSQGDAPPRLPTALAHDLRTPLGAIHTWARFLQDYLGDRDPQVARALEGIVLGVEQQLALIERATRPPAP